jgi:hypothetical protein
MQVMRRNNDEVGGTEMSVLDQDAPLQEREPTEEELYALHIEPDVVWFDDAEEDYQPQTNGVEDFERLRNVLSDGDEEDDDYEDYDE